MMKLRNGMQEYCRGGRWIIEYDFPSENVTVARDAIEARFSPDLPEMSDEAGSLVVRFSAGDARRFRFEELLAGPITRRLAAMPR